MVLKNLCILVLWAKVATVLEGLKALRYFLILSPVKSKKMSGAFHVKLRYIETL